MLSKAHPIAGLLGFAIILTFWTATIVSELSGSADWIVAVKRSIPWGFFVLIPALALTGATGFRMARGATAPEIARKRRRMPVIAVNGLLILVPCALYLSALAARRDFGALFFAVQALELAAGATNLTLMALNIRDGFAASGRFNRRRGVASPST